MFSFKLYTSLKHVARIFNKLTIQHGLATGLKVYTLIVIVHLKFRFLIDIIQPKS